MIRYNYDYFVRTRAKVEALLKEKSDFMYMIMREITTYLLIIAVRERNLCSAICGT